MMKKLKISVLAILILCSQLSFSQPKIIFDTDIGGDADDLGALAMLHNYVKRGDCELLANSYYYNGRISINQSGCHFIKPRWSTQ